MAKIGAKNIFPYYSDTSASVSDEIWHTPETNQEPFLSRFERVYELAFGVNFFVESGIFGVDPSVRKSRITLMFSYATASVVGVMFY